jgi:hypothetical protein
MEVNLREILQSFWDARKYPLIYFAVLYGLAVSSNLAVAAVQRSTLAAWLVGLGMPLVVLIVIITGQLSRFFPRSIETAILPKARHYRGLVVLISMGSGVETAEAAARYHAGASSDLYVWMLASAQSRVDAVGLEGTLISQGLVKHGHVFLIDLSDEGFENPESVRDAIERKVYGKLPEGIEERDVIIDVTGGRKTTTAGAFLAGLPAGRRMQVNNPSEVDAEGHGIKPGDPMEIVVDYRLKRISRNKT